MQLKLNQPQSIQIMRSQKTIQINLHLVIPKQFMEGNRTPTICLKLSRHNDLKGSENLNTCQSAEMRLKAQHLLQRKSGSILEEKGRLPDRFILTEKRVCCGLNEPDLNRISKHQSLDRQERERTRDNKHRQEKQRQPSFKAVSSSLVALLKQAMKITFQSKFNISDGIYALYNNTYSIRSSRHPGFMIVNEHPCKANQIWEIKFDAIISNESPYADECDTSDCGIGITFNPQDLLKKNKKNPVDKCMAYYFGRQMIRTCGEYEKIPIAKDEGSTYRLIVDIKNRNFIIMNEKEMKIVVKRMIPTEFLEHSVYVFVELKNKGKIKIL